MIIYVHFSRTLRGGVPPGLWLFDAEGHETVEQQIQVSDIFWVIFFGHFLALDGLVWSIDVSIDVGNVLDTVALNAIGFFWGAYLIWLYLTHLWSVLSTNICILRLLPDPQLEWPVQPLLHQEVDAAAALDTEL